MKDVFVLVVLCPEMFKCRVSIDLMTLAERSM